MRGKEEVGEWRTVVARSNVEGRLDSMKSDSLSTTSDVEVVVMMTVLTSGKVFVFFWGCLRFTHLLGDDLGETFGQSTLSHR